jgi:hypothetical protein
MNGRFLMTAVIAAATLGMCAVQSQARTFHHHGHGDFAHFHHGHGDFAHFHRGFDHAFYHPRFYGGFAYDFYRPYYYYRPSYYYYRPFYYPSYYYYYAPPIFDGCYRTSIESPPVVSRVIADPAPYRQVQPIRVTPVVPSGDGTFPYDGGPVRPIPQPRGVDPEPSKAPKPSVPLDGKLISTAPSKTSQYAYPAYGEDAAKKSARTVSGK